ncbi:hypothetical protein SJAV_26170 [Sulfurisphaera javensis]|uniref:Uncharacterized protein n=1 Tax=Sulfurisphaera javensis TaxID=2049879 RepID=A0AAT9GUS0_9CREN
MKLIVPVKKVYLTLSEKLYQDFPALIFQINDIYVYVTTYKPSLDKKSKTMVIPLYGVIIMIRVIEKKEKERAKVISSKGHKLLAEIITERLEKMRRLEEEKYYKNIKFM